MIVCHCTAVSDRTIAEAVHQGARDEFDVAEACGAGAVCGGCVPTITQLLGDCAGCPVEAARRRQPHRCGADQVAVSAAASSPRGTESFPPER